MSGAGLAQDDFRSAMHAGTGLVALGMGVFPGWFLLAGAGLGLLAGFVVIPMTPLEARLRRAGEPFFCGLRTYPLAVAALVVPAVLFPDVLSVTDAAIAWAVFAFGDAAASVVGRRVPAPRVFGHRKATWSGSSALLVVGALAGLAVGRFVAATGGAPCPPFARIALASLAATAIDLVPIPPDDNLPHAAAAAAVLALAPI